MGVGDAVAAAELAADGAGGAGDGDVDGAAEVGAGAAVPDERRHPASRPIVATPSNRSAVRRVGSGASGIGPAYGRRVIADATTLDDCAGNREQASYNSTSSEEVGTMLPSSASVGHQLTALLTPVVEEIGLDLEDVALVKQAGHQTPTAELRVLVDKDGGVNLDDVARVSLAISAALDLPAADVILGATPYVLEVSSPGVDRPLVEPRQWRRAVGRLVRVGLTAGGDVTGRILEVDAHGVRIAVVGSKPGAKAAPRTFRFGEIGPGRVQVEFNHPALDLHEEESG